MSPAKKIVSAISSANDPGAAIDDCCGQIGDALGTSNDLTIFFVAEPEDAERCGQQLWERTGAKNLIGCTAESVIGKKTELEMVPGLSVLSCALPGAEIIPFHLRFHPNDKSISGMPTVPLSADPRAFVLLPEPFSFPTDFFLEELNQTHPAVPVVGGVASGASRPGEARIFVNGEMFDAGAAGISLGGEIAVTCAVSQGCRPIGKPFITTKTERNVILELGGKPAMSQLQELFETLPTSEQRLVQNGLHLGRVVNEYQDRFEAGDFLIRNVIGFDEDSQGIGIADYTKVGQTVQFHIRDEQSAHEDLIQHLQRVRSTNKPLEGAMMFSCNGRGSRMFSVPHHDAATLSLETGDLPLAGFFAQGEIGPVGTSNYVHGLSASMMFFH